MKNFKSLFVFFMSFAWSSLFSQEIKETVTDYDGNVYNTVTIGNQIWLSENLKSLHYSDGSAISEVWVYDDNESNAELYGRLYTWDGAMNYSTTEGAQGVCPTGWHVPSDAEWTELGNYLGGNVVAGGKLKSTGTELWQEPNAGATNESGFSALPAGEYDDTHYQLLGQYAVIWSSTQTSTIWAKYRYLAYLDAELHPYNYYQDFRYSVRCVKDSYTGIKEINNIDQKVQIFPNPADKQINICFFSDNIYPVEIDILEVTGKYIDKKVIQSNNSLIDISGLPNGIFFLRFLNKEQCHIKQFIINDSK